MQSPVSDLGNRSEDKSRDTLHQLMNEANDVITIRDAERAGTTSSSRTVFRGWVECRGKSKRFYSWKRRFIVWNSNSRKLTVFADESLNEEKGFFIVTDCNIHFRGEGKKFWQVRYSESRSGELRGTFERASTAIVDILRRCVSACSSEIRF